MRPLVLLSISTIVAIVFAVTNAQLVQTWDCRSMNGVKTTESVVARSGLISDGPGGVRSNTWCEWIIQPPPLANGKPRRVKFTFRSFNMMSGEDFVWVFDDAVSRSVPVQRLTGTYMPEPFYSSSDAGLRVEYRSSEFGVGNAVAEEQGFEALFEIVEVKGVCNPNPCSDESVCIEDERGGHRCTRCPIGYTGDSSLKGGCVKVVPCPTPIVRKNLLHLTKDEKDLYFFALQSLRRSGLYDEIMWIHADKVNFNFAHFTDGFLPWHRQYLLMFERALQSVSPQCNCLGIPFFDWTMDAADPERSYIFTDEYFGGNGVDLGDGKKCVRSGQFQWTVLGNSCLQRDLNGAGFFATREEVLNAIASNERFRDFSRAIELFHDTVHRFFSGTMVLDNSADEPVFLSHHSFIDMLWSVWQDCHDYDQIPAASVRSNSNAFTGGIEIGSLSTQVNTDYNAPMPFRLAHVDVPVVPMELHDIRSLSYSYDNMHFLSDPATVEWFDPRWTTCTIESMELFKSNPEEFTKAVGASSSAQTGFQALQVFVTAPALYSGPTMNPEQICQGTYLNFTGKCNCFMRWSNYELRYVAKLMPSCQRQEILACLHERSGTKRMVF